LKEVDVGVQRECVALDLAEDQIAEPEIRED